METGFDSPGDPAGHCQLCAEFVGSPNNDEPRHRATCPHCGHVPWSVELDQIEISTAAIELMPASAARQTLSIPVELHEERLLLAAPWDELSEEFQQVESLLNRDIKLAFADPDSIIAAIERSYGPADRNDPT